MEEIYKKIVNKDPFCFVRINDGEALAIMDTNATPSRGDERSSNMMSLLLHNIISQPYIHDNLFIGVPCVSCYKDCHDFVIAELNNFKPQSFVKNNIVDANILINNNYNNTFDLLRKELIGRHVIIIANEISVGNIEKLKNVIPVSDFYYVSSKYAFDLDYERIRTINLPNNSFIITLCGPLGRILCYEWFKQNETLSCLDLGSFFDPLLRNKSYFYHTNNLGYCYNCYPTSYKGFSKIFEYCNHVVKECYYLNTIEEHMRLYNCDYNRILNNTNVRLENEKNEIFLHELHTYCMEQLLSYTLKDNMPSEGYVFQIDKQFKDIIKLCRDGTYTRILEIGFLAGSSSVLFLDNTDAHVTSIDIKCSTYSNMAKIFIDNEYPGRHTLIIEDSSISVPKIDGIFDLIFIDGAHSYEGTLLDIINCYYKSDENSYIVIDDIVLNTCKQAVWNTDATRAYQFCIDRNILFPVIVHEYEYGRGMSICRYKRNKQEILLNIPCIDSLLTNNININKISTHILELTLLKNLDDLYPSKSYEGYTYQIPELINDMIDMCGSAKSILEIGFLYGSSALMFLANTNASVTSIDIVCNNIVMYATNYLNVIFPKRFNFIHGSSSDIIPTLTSHYDIIFIDGNHEYDSIIRDLNGFSNIINDNTLIIMNDVVTGNNNMQVWNTGPTAVYNELIKTDMITPVFSKTYCMGRGIVSFIFKKKIN